MDTWSDLCAPGVCTSPGHVVRRPGMGRELRLRCRRRIRLVRAGLGRAVLPVVWRRLWILPRREHQQHANREHQQLLGTRAQPVWRGWIPLREHASAGWNHDGSNAHLPERRADTRNGDSCIRPRAGQCSHGTARNWTHAKCHAGTKCWAACGSASGEKRNAPSCFAHDASGKLQPRSGWRCK